MEEEGRKIPKDTERKASELLRGSHKGSEYLVAFDSVSVQSIPKPSKQLN